MTPEFATSSPVFGLTLVAGYFLAGRADRAHRRRTGEFQRFGLTRWGVLFFYVCLLVVLALTALWVFGYLHLQPEELAVIFFGLGIVGHVCTIIWRHLRWKKRQRGEI